MPRLDFRPEIDGPIYDGLADFLPDAVFDAHVHTALPEHIGSVSEERRNSGLSFFLDAASIFDYGSFDFFQTAHQTLFPQQKIEALLFGYPFRETNLDANNAYVLGLIHRCGVNALYLTRPDAGRDELEGALDRGFIGFKPYPDLAMAADSAPSVGDYLPATAWEAAHDREAIILIHINIQGRRLYDSHTGLELSAACRRYSKAKVIIPHLGGAFVPSWISDGIPSAFRLDNIWFDISPICESVVLTVAIRELGPRRLLFGTDSPPAYVRGRLGEWKGISKIFCAEDRPWNTRREHPEKEARYIPMIYEQLLALRDASKAIGLTRPDVQAILYNNAKMLTDGASAH